VRTLIAPNYTLDARLETRQQQGGVRFAWPRAASGYDYSTALRLRQQDIEGQQTAATTFSVRRDRTRGQISTTLLAQYQTETQRVSDLDTRNQAATLTYQWTRRDLGRAFYPARGQVLSLDATGALDSLLSDTSFLRLHGRLTRFFRAGETGRWVLRGELGSVLAERRIGIPTDFLFRAGGDNSVRGYAYQSLGRAEDGGVASVRHIVTGSVEYQHFFSDNWGIALFVDAGDAADSVAALSPVFGFGTGARYRSPVGPINVDVAYGEAEQKFRLHFSLGVTF
jgi:translocation and assembly module TamA